MTTATAEKSAQAYFASIRRGNADPVRVELPTATSEHAARRIMRRMQGPSVNRINLFAQHKGWAAYVGSYTGQSPKWHAA